MKKRESPFLKNIKALFKTLQGQKVALETFTMGDVTPEYVGWLNDPVVVRFSNQRFNVHSMGTCQAYVASVENTEDLFLKIVSRANGKTVGTIRANISLPHKTADIGILIGCRKVWGHGLGQDSWNTLMNWLLDEGGIRKVTGGTMRSNIAMVKIMQKTGMTLEAIRPAQELLEGRAQDLLYFGKFHDNS